VVLKYASDFTRVSAPFYAFLPDFRAYLKYTAQPRLKPFQLEFGECRRLLSSPSLPPPSTPNTPITYLTTPLLQHQLQHNLTSPPKSPKMAISTPPQKANALTVSLTHPHTTPNAYKSIHILDADGQSLTISLRRTIRVPDNGTTYNLPPDLGAFPIYNVLDHKAKLPAPLVEKGGVFVGIYRKLSLLQLCYCLSSILQKLTSAEREAMWIKFQATKPFAVKVYVGGVNAVSGEVKVVTEEMKAKRKEVRFHIHPP